MRKHTDYHILDSLYSSGKNTSDRPQYDISDFQALCTLFLDFGFHKFRGCGCSKPCHNG